MTTPISRAAVLEILRTPAESDTFPDMIRRIEALEPVAQPETGPGGLLRCPFCGGFPHTESTITDASVWCGTCKAKVVMKHYLGFTVDWDASPRVAAAWNSRATHEPTSGQFTTMCLAIEDVVTGRGFDVDPWQPIETAPKDGTWFLAGTAGAEWQRPRIVKFYDDYDRFPMHEDMRPWSVAPTHWQPLTKPGETTSAIPEEVKQYMRNALMVGGWRGERD